MPDAEFWCTCIFLHRSLFGRYWTLFFCQTYFWCNSHFLKCCFWPHANIPFVCFERRVFIVFMVYVCECTETKAWFCCELCVMLCSCTISSYLWDECYSEFDLVLFNMCLYHQNWTSHKVFELFRIQFRFSNSAPRLPPVQQHNLMAPCILLSFFFFFFHLLPRGGHSSHCGRGLGHVSALFLSTLLSISGWTIFVASRCQEIPPCGASPSAFG